MSENQHKSGGENRNHNQGQQQNQQQGQNQGQSRNNNRYNGNRNRNNHYRKNNYHKHSKPKLPVEETLEDIAADIIRIEKEIQLEIKEITTMRLGL